MLHCTLKFAWFWPLGALSLGPHGGHMYHVNDFESPAPKDDSCQVCLKSDQAFSNSRWNSYFLHRAPSPTCYPPHRGHWGHPGRTAMHNLYSSPKKVYTHYITLLFYLNWIWRRSLKFVKFWPLGALTLGSHGGHMYHMNTFEPPAPEDDSCQVWLKSNLAFLPEVDEQLLFT